MRLLLCFLLAPGLVRAECSEETLLSCPVSGSEKQIEMCLEGDQLTYSYGHPGKPELMLSEPLSAGTYMPWNGVGRSMWDVVAFYNDGYTYTVNWSVDRMDESLPVQAGVSVDEGGNIVVILTCAEGTAGPEFGSVLMERMQALGQCWDPTAQTWTASCN